MRKMRKRTAVAAAPLAALCGLAGAALLLASGGALARVEGDSAYSKAQTYSAALRYLRTELSYEIVERDPDAAYLIFKYRDGAQKDRERNGSLEIVEVSDKVRIYVQLPQMPEYHERVLRDGILKKLRDEYGAPTRPNKPSNSESSRKKPSARPDAGEGSES